MATSGRVQKEQTGIAEFSSFGKDSYAICKRGKKYRVYEDGSGYSQTSGQTLGLGKVCRGLDGKPVSFDSVEEADAWVRGGLKLIE